jgi:hypothetical protein
MERIMIDDINIAQFNHSQQCILTLLIKYGTLRTSEILDKTDEYPKMCATCKSGDSIIRAARKLEELGLVSKTIQKGGIIWKIAKKD